MGLASSSDFNPSRHGATLVRSIVDTILLGMRSIAVHLDYQSGMVSITAGFVYSIDKVRKSNISSCT